MINSIRSGIATTITALNRYSRVANTFVEANKILSKIKPVLEVAAKPLAEAGFKAVGMTAGLISSGSPGTSSIADGFNG
jgi:hypothetical protein